MMAAENTVNALILFLIHQFLVSFVGLHCPYHWTNCSQLLI